MATIATIAVLAAATISAAASYRQGQYLQAVSEAQAKQQEYEAEAVTDQADLEIAQHRRDVQKFKSFQRTSLLKSGVQIQGSALDLLADTEIQSKMDEDIIRYNAEVKAQNLRYGATLSRAEGSQAASAGKIGAATTLLSSAGKYSLYTNRKSLLARS